ncbi:MAG: hypothetical protein IPO83_03790 [Chitinophagaceae bacterium]|nr:hypothetical protein [Chitinophagaceae bacterium]
MELIPDAQLEILAAESKVGFQVKKLTGKCMFQLILFSMINSERASLRVMEAMFHSMQFRLVARSCPIAVVQPKFFLHFSIFEGTCFCKYRLSECIVYLYDCITIYLLFHIQVKNEWPSVGFGYTLIAADGCNSAFDFQELNTASTSDNVKQPCSKIGNKNRNSTRTATGDAITFSEPGSALVKTTYNQYARLI